MSVVDAGTGEALETPEARRASDRITRSIAFLIGLVGVLLGLVESGEIATQADKLDVWFTPVATVLVFGACLVVLASAFTAPMRFVRRACAGLAVGQAIVVAIAPFAISHDAIQGEAFWLLRVVAIGCAAAALAWRPGFAFGYLGVIVAGAAVVSGYSRGETGLLGLVLDFTRNAGLSAIFVWAIRTILHAASVLDAETTRGDREAGTAAATAAKLRERARFAALIHDGVLSTLLDASRGRESPVLSGQAQRTLAQLDEFRSGGRRRDVFDAGAAITFMRTAVAEINVGVAFEAKRLAGFDDLRLPVEAAETIVAALSEAVRNSLRHAAVPGRAVHREVTVTVSAGGLRVEIADDGAGFDVDTVPAHRLGLSLSILGRMRELSGGAAFVESERGHGTTVTLVWGSGARG